MNTLIELGEKYTKLLEIIIEEGDSQVLQDTLDSINDALEDKADGCVAVIRRLEGDNEAIDKEINRLRRRKTTNKNGIQRIKESLQYTMETTNKEKFKTKLNSFTIAKNKPSLVVTDEKQIPKEYWVPQAPTLNKSELLKDIQNGEDIPGAGTKQTRSLRIR
ncbi:siphovirus Gp157 family protein [Staphylococcus auricularis]|uniref:siphovirus Gp157 family protein n=1 Tax=Staphylococcus auricularis TaxID=29379 RepID=UPI001F280050|nr:siphovirus Gp157 family protein [Staphylococcus auricularis]MCE5038422.1 siphovirus Gp157 family protein [Staphylococcus auricularis]